MERSSVIVADDEPRERHIATLTLTRGATTWGSWAFDADDAGVTISVGGCTGCDWQVAAPGVGPLLVLFTGERLLIKNDGASEAVWLNGARLWPSWVPLEHGDRVELGMSCMEVALLNTSTDDMISGERWLPAEPPQPARGPTTQRQPRRQPTIQESGRAQRSPYESWGGETARADGGPTRTTRVVPPASHVPLDTEQLDAMPPSILGRAIPTVTSEGLRRASIASIAFAVAYAAWIVVLDHI